MGWGWGPEGRQGGSEHCLLTVSAVQASLEDTQDVAMIDNEHAYPSLAR